MSGSGPAIAAGPAGRRRQTRVAGPWRIAFGALSRMPSAMGALAVLAVLVGLSLGAPLYARHVAHTDPFESDVGATVIVDGRELAVMQPNHNRLHLGLTPIGPTWRFGADLLGADSQGRDVMARLLYGGRNSLVIAAGAAALCIAMAAAVGICAGFFGGVVDAVLSRMMDVMWAIPVYLFAISLSIVTVSQGLRFGPVEIRSDSLLLPIGIIALVYVPYAARPIRGRVLSLREAEFVLAARCLGVPPVRILLRDVLPNVAGTLIVLAPLLTALALLAESALSFLSIGVQAPAASWGTIIQDGQGLIYTRPAVAVAPGLAIVATVLALNMLGDGLRDALDVRETSRRRS